MDLAVGTRTDVDDVVRSVLSELSALRGVRRVGLALTEGGGRRLRFTASDRVATGSVDWCHIDAYDDVPLTRVVRTGRPVVGGLDDLDPRFAAMVEGQRNEGVTGVAAVALPGRGNPVGGVVLFFEEPRAWEGETLRRAKAVASRAASVLEGLRSSRASASVAGRPLEVEGDEAAAIEVDADLRAASVARRFVRSTLRDWGADDDLVDAAQLCVSEVVTNAVTHAGTPSRLRLARLAEVLRVVVSDQGGPGTADGAHPSRDEDVLRVHGRGLQLVDALTAGWGADRDEVGTTVWFELAWTGTDGA